MAHELRMTVAQLRATMSQEEFMKWWVYFGRKAQREQLRKGGRHGGDD